MSELINKTLSEYRQGFIISFLVDNIQGNIMQKFKTARFVKNPVTGIEGGALLVDHLLFDVDNIWYACMYGVSSTEFYNLTPAGMSEIALELFAAEMIDAIK